MIDIKNTFVTVYNKEQLKQVALIYFSYGLSFIYEGIQENILNLNFELNDNKNYIGYYNKESRLYIDTLSRNDELPNIEIPFEDFIRNY